MDSEKQAAALDSVTDYVADKEIDEARVKDALSDLRNAQESEKANEARRHNELMAVKINAEDVATIEGEFEIPKKDAEMKLRECGGDLKKALTELVSHS